MPVFDSCHPRIDIPCHLPVWTWLFDSEYSPLNKATPSQVQGYTNAATNEHVSYTDLKLLSTHLSTALIKRFGFKEGDTVALFSPNTVWYPVAMFAVLRAGGTVSGASPAYNNEEMAYALKVANAKWLFTVPGSLDVALAATTDVGISRDRVFLLEGNMDGFLTMSDLLKIGKDYGETNQSPQFRLPAGKTNKDVCGFLSFSSGTTGLPKAVMIAHSNVIAQVMQIEQITPPSHRRILAVLPLFHITGLVHQLHLPIMLNANVYMLPSFTMESMLDTVARYRIEEMLVVPPILIRMVREPEILAKYDLQCVKRFSSGAAPLSAKILALLQETFPGTGFKQGYGMTESCSCITSHPPEKYGFQYAFRVGTLVANTQMKIVDPTTGKECQLNEPGEIWARGPQVVMGYLNNREATDETFDRDGFLHTGDIGFLDEEGMLTISDRLKEMIKVKGIGVAPAELEDTLLGHEVVKDVAVLGMPDDYAGERPKAFVVLKQSALHNPRRAGERLIKHVQENKVRHKWIREIQIVHEIPKSPSGKILRRVLRDLSKQGIQGVVVRDGDGRAKL
ncbi:CoA ligase [Coniochaeta sp. 2T2.1]|nr:CoA ligase [Coniochaeta sp. 2T2.1]